ncbi:MAG: histidine kinase [Bacteroidia bacterium]|nr:histidine kinase [Bacteroidia bacterium]
MATKTKFFWFEPVAKDAQGHLYFGAGNQGATSGGLDRILPERYSSAASAFVYLRSLTVNQKHLSLPAGVNHLEEISLKHNQNTIAIETGIIDYYSMGKGGIRYKLERQGADEEWQYAPAYYTIRYEGLPPGSYRLLMQASNSRNQFSKEVKTLTIHISPAFWNSWWFRIVAVLALVVIIYSIVRWRLHQKFQSQLKISEKEKQLAELQQQKSELENAGPPSQMNPHFIFNCLSSINRFILKNEPDTASDYLTKFSRLIRMILQTHKPH